MASRVHLASVSPRTPLDAGGHAARLFTQKTGVKRFAETTETRE